MKKLASAILSIIVLLALPGLKARAETDPVFNADTVGSTLASGEYYLTEDQCLTNNLTVAAGQTAVIDLKGYTLDVQAVLTVESGASLTVRNGNVTNEGTVFGGDFYCSFANNGGTVNRAMFFGTSATGISGSVKVEFRKECNGTLICTEYVVSGGTLREPAQPEKDYYNFNCWKNGSGQTFSFSSAISSDMTGSSAVYADWTPVAYGIIYNLGGGTASGNPISYTVEETFTLVNPTRDGFLFTGWSGTGLTGSANMTVTVPVGSSGARTYTANWAAVTATPVPATNTPTPVPATNTPVPTSTPVPATNTPVPTNTPTPTKAPKATNTPTPTKAPKATNTPTPTSAPKATNTPTPTKAPKATNTPTPGVTNTPTPVPSEAPTSEPTPTPESDAPEVPTDAPEATATPTPVGSDNPSAGDNTDSGEHGNGEPQPESSQSSTKPIVFLIVGCMVLAIGSAVTAVIFKKHDA